MKYTGPKARICRRLGTNIYGSDKYDKIMQRKPVPPGKAPRARLGRQSEYAKQLIEKQKVRFLYGLSEKQFRRIYDLAMKTRGQTGDMIKSLLEQRLDNLLYRAGFAQTRLQARQFAGHGLFRVNDRRVTVPSFRVKPGDVITVTARGKNSPVFVPILAAHEKYLPPSWMKVDSAAMRVEVAALPAAQHAEQAIDIRQVIEFYSRN